MAEMKIGLAFGPMGDLLSDQLEKQGFTLPEKKNKLFQDLVDALNIVHLHRFIPDSAYEKALERLMKKILDEIVPLACESKEQRTLTGDPRR